MDSEDGPQRLHFPLPLVWLRLSWGEGGIRVLFWQGEGAWEVTANECGVSFWGGENILELGSSDGFTTL